MQKQTIAKDSPLSEITLRRYEKPYDLTGRNLVKKLCLSLGLLQPGDSRDVIVDVFHVFLKKKNEGKALTSEAIKNLVIETRKSQNLPLLGIASSNIRRQILRLRNLMIVEKINNDYRITEFNNLHENFKDKVEAFLLPSIMERVKDYLREVDEKFS